ncbi:MAG: trigger factor [Oscillospiraceae bacterium]|nr:trigger factor [Candidatus Equicaccousia limihippi]
MSLKNAEKKENSRYELTVTISGEDFSAAVTKAYQQNVKKISLPGFRKGKAPQKMIEAQYGEGFSYEDALNLLCADALEEAAKEAGVEIIDDKMDFDLVSIDRTNGVEFKVTLTVKPEVKVKKYKGLKAEKVKCSVSAKEVNDQINSLAERNSRMVTVTDRAAQNGDITVIDFDGYKDGVQFDGGKAEGYSLTLGSGQFIPGFEEQVVGHKTGDEFDVNVKFPEDYGAEELAGADAVFKIKLHEIKVKELPEIDDEFAKDVSEFDTLEELKKDTKAHLLEHKKEHAENDVENQLVEQLAANVEGEIPEAMYNVRVEQELKEYEYRMQMQGMNLDMYLQYTGSTIDDLKKNIRPAAEQQVKIRLALETIAKTEKLVATDKDVKDEIANLAKQYNMTEEQIEKALPKEEIAKDLAVRKAVEFVKANAEITEVTEKTEKAAKTEKEAKPAAKKPAAKKETAAKKTTSAAAKKPAAKTASKTTAAKKPAVKKPAAKKETK